MSERKSILYEHEVGVNFHEKLIAELLNLKGVVVLSGYRTDLYDSTGWVRVEKDMVSTLASRARGAKIAGVGSAKKHAHRVECLWLNERCVELLQNI
jgi:DNA adenine methylase